MDIYPRHRVDGYRGRSAYAFNAAAGKTQQAEERFYSDGDARAEDTAGVDACAGGYTAGPVRLRRVGYKTSGRVFDAYLEGKRETQPTDR